MQGKKIIRKNPSLPSVAVTGSKKENFYRRLKETLDLEFLYPLTQKFTGIAERKILIR